nr:acetyl-CoA acetyltransferase, cytosolic 1-like [Tanacetum cinerariifolium]
YHRAAEKGRFRKELVPVFVPQPKGDAALFDTDEQPRVSTLEKLATLKPAFQPDGGTVTAGNAAGINDGAAAALLVSEDALKRFNLQLVGGGGRRPSHYGHGPGASHPQGARACRPYPRRHGPHRAQRSLCFTERGCYPRTGPRCKQGERERRLHCHGPPTRVERGAHRGHAGARDAAPRRRALRFGDHVRGCGPGRGHGLRKNV